MFFPIGDNNIEQGSKPILTYTFIALNIVVFVYQFLMPMNTQQAFVIQYGSIPKEITNGVDLFTLLTSMFLHGGWMHLIGNMMFLWVFGDNIEATIGYGKYFLFYVSAGIIASLSHALLNPISSIPCVGASGAIAGVLGAYLVMFPKSKIKILFVLFMSIFSVPAIYFLGFWIVQQFMSGVGSLSVTNAEVAGTAYWAHIGGFVFGVLMGYVFRSKANQMVLASN